MRRPPTRGARASRARSGRRCRRCTTQATCAARPSRRPLSRLTWPIEARTHRARASARAGAAVGGRTPRPRRSLAQANGWERRLGARHGCLAAAGRRCPIRPCSPPSGARDVPRHRSRAHGDVLGGVVRRAVPVTGRDRPQPGREGARADRAHRSAALLHAAPERRAGRRARHPGEPRAGARA